MSRSPPPGAQQEGGGLRKMPGTRCCLMQGLLAKMMDRSRAVGGLITARPADLGGGGWGGDTDQSAAEVPPR